MLFMMSAVSERREKQLVYFYSFIIRPSVCVSSPGGAADMMT